MRTFSCHHQVWHRPHLQPEISPLHQHPGLHQDGIFYSAALHLSMVLMHRGQILEEYLVKARLPVCKLRHKIIGAPEIPLFDFLLHRVGLQESCSVRLLGAVRMLRSMTCCWKEGTHCRQSNYQVVCKGMSRTAEWVNERSRNF